MKNLINSVDPKVTALIQGKWTGKIIGTSDTSVSNTFTVLDDLFIGKSMFSFVLKDRLTRMHFRLVGWLLKKDVFKVVYHSIDKQVEGSQVLKIVPNEFMMQGTFLSRNPNNGEKMKGRILLYKNTWAS